MKNLNADYRYIKYNFNILKDAENNLKRGYNTADFVVFQKTVVLNAIKRYEENGGRRDLSKIKNHFTMEA